MFGLGVKMGSHYGPLAIPGAMFFWDARVGISLNSGNVSSWFDQSGNGNTISNATSAAQPLFTTASSHFNGNPIVTTSGSASTPTYLSTSGSGFVNNSALFFWICCRVLSVPNTNNVLLGYGNLSAIQCGTNGKPIWAGRTSSATWGSSVVGSSVFICGFAGSGTSATTGISVSNGAYVNSSVTSGISGTQTIALGCSASSLGTNPANVEVTAAGGYNNVLSATDQTSLYRFCQQNYGVV